MKIQKTKGFFIAITLTIFVGITLIVVIGLETLRGINSWFMDNTFQFNNPVHFEIAFKPLLEVVKREEVKVVIVDKAKEEMMLEADKYSDKDLARYICEKFGTDCKIALAVAKAESGFRCDAINVNTNGTIDVGLWQINMPTHEKRIEYKDAFDCYKSTDVAYEIWKEQGWNPWVAYTNQSYLARLGQ